MIIYILIYLIGVILASINIIFKGKGKKIYLSYYITFLLVGLLVGLRDSFGFDDSMYIDIFRKVSSNFGYYRQIEYSYVIFSKIISNLGLNYQAVYLLYSLSAYYCFYKGLTIIVQDNKQRVLFLCYFYVFLFLDSFVIMRQFLAVSLIFISYANYIIDKKKKSILFYIFAVLIHNSAIITIVPILFYNVFKKKNIHKLLLLLLTMYIFQYIPYERLLNEITKKFLGYRNNYFIRTFILNHDQWYPEPLGITSSILLVLFMISFYLYRKNKSRVIKYSYSEFLFLLGYSYFFLYMILSRVGRINRISWYFIPFALTCCSQFINYIKIRERKIVRFGLIISISLLFIITMYRYTSTKYTSYIFRQYSYNLNIFKD